MMSATDVLDYQPASLPTSPARKHGHDVFKAHQRAQVCKPAEPPRLRLGDSIGHSGFRSVRWQRLRSVSWRSSPSSKMLARSGCGPSTSTELFQVLFIAAALPARLGCPINHILAQTRAGTGPGPPTNSPRGHHSVASPRRNSHVKRQAREPLPTSCHITGPLSDDVAFSLRLAEASLFSAPSPLRQRANASPRGNYRSSPQEPLWSAIAGGRCLHIV